MAATSTFGIRDGCKDPVNGAVIDGYPRDLRDPDDRKVLVNSAAMDGCPCDLRDPDDRKSKAPKKNPAGASLTGQSGRAGREMALPAETGGQQQVGATDITWTLNLRQYFSYSL